MEAWGRVFVLSLGGVLGVNARYWLGVWMNKWASPQFPWATFSINVTGSFAFGLLVTVLAQWLPHPHARIMVLTGFLGGYTTFSSFAYESLALWERGERGLAFTNIAGSVFSGIVAVAVGVGVGRSLTGEAAPKPAASRHAAPAPGYGPAPRHLDHEGAVGGFLGAERVDEFASEGWAGGGGEEAG